MKPLSSGATDELKAIHHFVAALGRPTFQWRHNYHGEIQSLHRRGLITWRPGQAEGFSAAFAAVNITDAGRAALGIKGEG